MARTLSEGQAWDGVEEIGSGLQASKDAWVRELGRELMAMAAEMRGQLAKGMHTNPLVIYGNPSRLMSARVYEVRYRHRDDGQDYVHKFKPNVEMVAIERNGKHDILLTHRRGLSVWEDFR